MTKAPTATMTRVLDALVDGPLGKGELMDKAHVAASGITNALAGLVTRGLITPAEYDADKLSQEGDGTARHSLTAAGREHLGLPAEEEATVAADLDDAVAAAVARQDAGKELELTPSGKVAKMVRLTLDVRITTDGRWIVARRGDKWALLAVANGVAQYRGEYPTCTAALAPEVIA